MAGLEPVGESLSKIAAMSLILLGCPVVPLAAAETASLVSSLGLLGDLMLVFVGDWGGGGFGAQGEEAFPDPGDKEGARGMPGEEGVALGREDFLTGDRRVGLEFFLIIVSFPFCSCFFVVAFSILVSGSSLLGLLLLRGGLSRVLPQVATRALTLISSSRSLLDALLLLPCATPGLWGGAKSGIATGLAGDEFFLGGQDFVSPELARGIDFSFSGDCLGLLFIPPPLLFLRYVGTGPPEENRVLVGLLSSLPLPMSLKLLLAGDVRLKADTSSRSSLLSLGVVESNALSLLPGLMVCLVGDTLPECMSNTSLEGLKLSLRRCPSPTDPEYIMSSSSSSPSSSGREGLVAFCRSRRIRSSFSPRKLSDLYFSRKNDRRSFLYCSILSRFCRSDKS